MKPEHRKHLKSLAQLLAKELHRLRKMRRLHPSGEFDKARRFTPDSDEWCECCDDIRKPSARWPNSLMLHCRTRKHIDNLIKKHGADSYLLEEVLDADPCQVEEFFSKIDMDLKHRKDKKMIKRMTSHRRKLEI